MKKLLLLSGVVLSMVGASSGLVADATGISEIHEKEDPSAIDGGGYALDLTESRLRSIQTFASVGNGGTYYGGIDNMVYSRYHHPRFMHSATAKNGVGGSVRDKQNAGIWANARCKPSLWGNTSWWNNL